MTSNEGMLIPKTGNPYCAEALPYMTTILGRCNNFGNDDVMHNFISDIFSENAGSFDDNPILSEKASKLKKTFRNYSKAQAVQLFEQNKILISAFEKNYDAETPHPSPPKILEGYYSLKNDVTTKIKEALAIGIKEFDPSKNDYLKEHE